MKKPKKKGEYGVNTGEFFTPHCRGYNLACDKWEKYYEWKIGILCAKIKAQEIRKEILK